MNITISDFIDNEYKDYSKYVLYSRAIPSVIDGLKPSQRKVLYTALKEAKTNRIKTSSLAGNCISVAEYHHGPASLEDAINKMAQTFNNNLPLLEGEGSFGSRLVPEAAAARYTYVKLSKNFDKFFLDNDILPEHIDPDNPEPQYYLPILPWVLINGITGIAVGFATEIQPRHPKDVAKACISYLSGKDIGKVKIPPSFPEFSGVVEQRSDGKWYSVGVYNLSGTKLTITELPTGYDREKYVAVLDKLQEDNKIVRYVDQCNKTGFNFEVTLPRGSKIKDVEKTFRLSTALNENITTIVENGDLKLFDNVNEVIEYFCDFRLKQYEKRYKWYIERDTAKLQKKMMLFKFIKSVLDGKIIIKGKNKQTLKDELVASGYTDVDSLLSIPVYRLCRDELDKLDSDMVQLKNDIEKWKTTDHRQSFIDELKGV
jgi:DNA topoisomerase-2